MKTFKNWPDQSATSGKHLSCFGNFFGHAPCDIKFVWYNLGRSIPICYLPNEFRSLFSGPREMDPPWAFDMEDIATFKTHWTLMAAMFSNPYQIDIFDVFYMSFAFVSIFQLIVLLNRWTNCLNLLLIFSANWSYLRLIIDISATTLCGPYPAPDHFLSFWRPQKQLENGKTSNNITKFFKIWKTV